MARPADPEYWRKWRAALKAAGRCARCKSRSYGKHLCHDCARRRNAARRWHREAMRIESGRGS